MTQLLTAVTLDNVSDGETVYQRCLLLSGRCPTGSDNEFITVSSTDTATSAPFPSQNWPVSEGRFKSLLILSPGTNFVILQHYNHGQAAGSASLTINYIPLLQTPPLLLAIMIAKDSPLLIDCPQNKQGGISSAHSDLNAAINKFRMTAYMWQALTAEDMRSKGLGRRSFRFEEEWTTETLSRTFLQASLESAAGHMRSTAKIHLIRSEKTVAELRDAQVAQQNPHGRNRDDLHKYFSSALKVHGGPFTSSAHPVVAGLLLDATYSSEQNLILGHAALGASNPNGLSLGIFGSHLTYSWPRFLEEVPSALLDTTIPGDTVGNDNGECGTMWEACSIGQGAFLHEVGHAFGADHTTGIMARGYAQDWPKNFLSHTAYCAKTRQDGFAVIDGETKNDARWDLCDALSFRVLPHFRLPEDPLQTREMKTAEPSVQVVFEDDNEEFLRLVINSPAKIARIKFEGVSEPEPSLAAPLLKIQFTLDQLEARFDRSQPLTLEVLGMNGKSRVVGNVWKLFSNVSFIRIPGSSIVLQKRSIKSQALEMSKNDSRSRHNWDWTVLLNEKDASGTLNPATMIDSRVGCILDGAVVYFKDGHKTNCGPRWSPGGGNHSFGGHASQKIKIPEGVDIVKVQVGSEHNELNGLRFHLSDGTSGGYLYSGADNKALEPTESEKIIGFYGTSDWGRGFNGIQEFGIITAPKNVDLPAIIYDLPELQNTDGGNGPRGDNGNGSDSENNSNDDDDDNEEIYHDEDEYMEH